MSQQINILLNHGDKRNNRLQISKKNGIFAVANHNKHTNSNTLKHNTIQWHYCTVINP